MYCVRKVHFTLLCKILSLLLLCLGAWNLPGGARESQSTSVRDVTAVPAGAPAGEPQGDGRMVDAAYGKLPLSFEANLGQWDSRVQFFSRGRNRALWLTKDAVFLGLSRAARVGSSGTEKGKKTSAVLSMRFAGANANPQIEGESQQDGRANYLVGKASQWRTNVPLYSRVRYRNLYPGIDLVFYGNNRQLEYDLVVSPGSDPSRIRMEIFGTAQVRIDGNGDLVLKTDLGDIIQQKPRVYQRKNTKLVELAGKYVIHRENRIGFEVGNFDPALPVVIDPVLRYASYLSGGGDENDDARGIAVDSSNRAVVAGYTGSINFPGEGGPEVTGSAFVLKLDFTGTRMVFVSFVSGPYEYDNVQVAVDSADNIYLAGSTFGNTYGYDTFVATPGAFQQSFAGETDAWVAKLNSSGTKVMYATFLGGSRAETLGGIAVDAAGNAYVSGTTTSWDFPVTPGAFQRECSLRIDNTCSSAFVTKLNPAGSQAVYSSYLGGHGTQSGEGIAVKASGSAVVVGQTDADDFPTTAGTQQPAFGGTSDAFVTQLNPSGTALGYSTFLGGSRADRGMAIALDAAGNAFITGGTESANFPVKSAYQPSCTGTCSFVSKLNGSGRLIYSTFLGSGGGSGTGIAATSGGEAFVAGEPGSNFPITQNAFQRVLGPQGLGGGPGGSVYLTKFGTGGQLIYSSYFGGGLGNPKVAVDKSANAHLVGNVGWGGLVPATPGALQTEKGAEQDGFIAKIVGLCALSIVDRSVTICAPSNASTVKSPVTIVAGTTDITPVKLTQIYLDGAKIYETPLSAIYVTLPISPGVHRMTVQSLDTKNVVFKKTVYVTVTP